MEEHIEKIINAFSAMDEISDGMNNKLLKSLKRMYAKGYADALRDEGLITDEQGKEIFDWAKNF